MPGRCPVSAKEKDDDCRRIPPHCLCDGRAGARAHAPEPSRHRRTGQTHRVNGSPLVIFTRNPAEAVADLLEGRDPTVWEARVEPIGAP